MQPWTDSDTQQLMEMLARLPARKPLPIFLWFCANTVGVPLEAVFLRVANGRKQVLLKRRPPKDQDPIYGGMLAVKGAMVQTADVPQLNDPDLYTNPFREVLKRILTEAGLTKFGAPPRNVTSRLYPSDRGPVCQQVFLCTVPKDETPAFLNETRKDGLSTGGWYDIEALPSDIISDHVSLIKLAAQYM